MSNDKQSHFTGEAPLRSGPGTYTGEAPRGSSEGKFGERSTDSIVVTTPTVANVVNTADPTPASEDFDA
ncbi:MAG: hypothetical protein ACOH17_04310 [Cellulomonas sp.]